MKRTPLKRGQPLRRSGRLQRTQLKAKGKRTKKSGGHLFPKLVDRRYRAWIRGFPCCLNHIGFQSSDAAHVRSRGAGGADRANLVPLCRSHHMEQHRIGTWSFQQRYGRDLAAEAKALDELYQREVGS